MYACDFVGHKTAAASKYRMPKPPLERRSVGNADRVGDGMVIAVKGWMEVTSSCALLNFVSLFFRGRAYYVHRSNGEEAKEGRWVQTVNVKGQLSEAD
jgi:hypothetical protein